MQILTPSGYKDIADCVIGEELCAFDGVTGLPIINHLLEKDRLLPKDNDYADRTTYDEDGNEIPISGRGWNWYLINGSFLLFQDQSIWFDGPNVTHASKLQVGDWIFDDQDRRVQIETIEVKIDGVPQEWCRLTVDGDHSYIADGIALHNASRYAVATSNSVTWDAATTTNWSTSNGGAGGASVPTSADDVSFTSLTNATAYTATISATANCANLTFALPATSGVPTLAGSSQLNIYGNLSKVSGMSWTLSGTVVFSATATGKTVASAGVAFGGSIQFNGVGGGWTLQDDITSGGGFSILAGQLVDAGYTVTLTATGGNVVSIGSSVASVTKTGNWILGGTGAGTRWNITNTSFSINDTAGYIKFSGNTTNTITFAGNGLTYKKFWSSNTSAGGVTITGANTFGTITKNDGTSAFTITFPGSATTTITSAFEVSGASTKLVTLASSAGIATLNYTGAGKVSCDYLSISNSTATPGSTFYAGTHSTDGGNNSGWTFTAPPAGGNRNFFAFF